MRKRIAVVISDVFLRRLTPALSPFVRSGQDFWMIDIARPVKELRRLIRETRPAGILTEELPERTEAILDLGFPTAVADSDTVFENAVSVDVDDWEVGEKAALFLFANGFRQFAFVGNHCNYSRQRGEGFLRGLSRLGFEADCFLDSERKLTSYMEHYQKLVPQLKSWLMDLPRPVAIFAAHDPLGRLLCEVCRECSLPIPEEVAVVGANNDELLCNLSYPPLSSVAIPWLKIGRMAAQCLDEAISTGAHLGKAYRIGPGDVVARESSDFTALGDPLLRRALVFLRRSFQEPMTIHDLCRELHINRRTLELRFKATLGRTPRQELERLRVAKARSLLAETDFTMDWIAQQCGFNDAERLAVVFRKATGEPPSHYRRRLLMR